jgi:hypothetical protein
MARMRLLTIVLLLAATWCLSAEDKDALHLTGNATVSGLNINDGAGFRWSINSNGMVVSSTGDSYGNGMQLTVNQNGFSWGQACKVSADGREIELGPVNNSQVNVYRRIYVDNKKGYCRWIDIYDNTTASNVTLTLQYYTNTNNSTQQIYTTSGKEQLTEKDWGVLTLYGENTTSPALAHIYASKNAKFKPKFQYRLNDNTIYCNASVTVPARKAIALCFFEAQRKPADAKKFLDGFNVTEELEKVPPALRKIIVNMAGGSTLTLGKIELARNEKQDLAVLRNGDELMGDLDVEKFEMETAFGKLSLDAKRVVGVVSLDAEDSAVHLVLTDGQVVVGKLLSGPLKMKLASGSEMSLQPDKFKTVSFRLSKEKPEEVGTRNAAVVLRSGQQLFFNPSDIDLTFQSEYGDLKLSPAQLSSLVLETPDGGLHRAIFRNGSVLSGLLKTASFKLQLDLGQPFNVPVSMIEQFVFPAPDLDHDKLAEVALRNEDQLLGVLLDESLTVQTRMGKVLVKPAEIAEAQFVTESLGQVQIKLHNGTTVTGKMTTQNLRFRIEPGPELPLFVGHIIRFTCPPPANSPATGAAGSQPAPAPTGDAGAAVKSVQELSEDRARADAAAAAARDEAIKKEKELRARAAAGAK